MLVVLKRDGTKEQFDVTKIRNVVNMACDGLPVNPVELEAKFDQFISNEITTEQIHDNLIYHARTLASPSSPAWNWVAGRLLTMKRWHTTCAYDVEFLVYFKEMMTAGIYKHPWFSEWSDEEIEKVGNAIVQERDLDLSYAAMVNAEKKYLLDGECMQQLFMVNAMILSTHEANRVESTIRLYDALSQRKISLATPWVSNLRRGENINSCYVLDIEDDLVSIYDNIKNAALISKSGGGIGVNIGRIRAKGADVNSVKKASKGVVPMARVLNDTMVYIDQNGRRAGAATLCLPIYHADIEHFLAIQLEGGDYRDKCFDIFPQVKIRSVHA